GAPEAYDEMVQRAGKREKPAVEVLGKIGDERAVDTLVEYVGADLALEKATLRALGEIGSEDATQAIANRLVADNPEIRTYAARALGRIGDARAVDPLSDVLDDDDDDNVRASAAWALRQIGTERALEAASEYTDDRSYVVQNEAATAADALSTEEPEGGPEPEAAD
ncbi:MAG: HEAT repeat domain-containing protein, partial [Haloferacaceae archaeon]